MASTAPGFDFSAVLTASHEWINECLIRDGSMFTDQQVWTSENLDQLHKHYVLQPNAGDGSFLEKLAGQLQPASEAARMLMAEVYWALQLFPSNRAPGTKEADFRKIALLAGREIPSDARWLSTEVLAGVGSGGPAYSVHFWRELVYAIKLFIKLKASLIDERISLLSDYEQLTSWLATEAEGDRQFRHMLRFFAFPELVERISSNGDRREILRALDGVPSKTLETWTDLQLDRAVLALRHRLADELGTTVLDFYESPLKQRWGSSDTPIMATDSNAGTHGGADVAEPKPRFPLPDLPTNLILYGPPGTGKTRQIEHLKALYSDTITTVNTSTWLIERVAEEGWLSVFVASLAALGKPSRAVDIAATELAWAKAQPTARRARVVTPPIGPYLREHAVESVAIPPSWKRRTELVFDRDERGDWLLIPDWPEIVPEAAQLLAAWQAGPKPGTADVQRYRMVTFHPSYGYEDFVQGIRPVENEQGETVFQMVDGAFKHLCDTAARNPAQRYAILIDEINRANLSKVFGELITLIEPDKRIQPGTGSDATGTRVQLAGSDILFGVPSNVDIYGTMNTADRSIALMDVALRRRFRFQEMPPDYAVLGEHVAGIDLARLLRRINDRLEYLLDADHRIGHGYLTGVASLEDLRRAFAEQIIPLLEEYFFDRKDRIAMVLSDRYGACHFTREEALSAERLFSAGLVDEMHGKSVRFSMTQPTTWDVDHFAAIYA